MKTTKPMNRWDTYFLGICQAVAGNSVCYSRKIGAILVQDKSIISTGYNGPPRGIHHCGSARIDRDPFLREAISLHNIDVTVVNKERCPRRLMGYKSGEALVYCPAAHAEQNCVANAARTGAWTQGATLYMNDQVPCRVCLAILINAGIEKIVVTSLVFYDEAGKYIVRDSDLTIRNYNHEYHEINLEN